MTSKPVLEPAAQQFADATANPPFLFDLGPEKGREAVDQVQSGDIAKPDVDVSNTTVPGGPSGEVSIRILRPRDATGPLPVIVYIHGAGWVFGNAHTHDRLIRELAVGANAAVVFPNYSLSPEAKYPTAIEESYAVAAWVAQHGAEQNLDPTRIAVAGDSVGGNMTAALTLLAKQRGDVSFVQQVLFYPVTDANFDTESYHQYAEGYFLRRDAMQWFWDQYTTDPAQRAEITASPLRASLNELADLPPALVITGEADVLRDEGEAYAAKLRAAGVSVTAARYQGIIHDFVMLNALRGTHAASAAIAQAITALTGALHPTADNHARKPTPTTASTPARTERKEPRATYSTRRQTDRRRVGEAVRTLATGLWLPALLLAGLLFSYLPAFHHPAPHHVSIAVAASPTATARLQHELGVAAPGGFTLRPTADAAEARAAVLHQSAVAAYLPGGPHPLLYGAKADGAALETVIRQTFAAVAGRAGGTLAFRELVPAVPGDTSGTSLLYVVLSCALAAYFMVVAMQRAVGFTRRAHVATSIGWGAVAAAVAYLAAAYVVQAIPPHPLDLLYLFLLTQAVSLTAYGLTPFFGGFFPGIAITLFILLGVPSSGGAIPVQLIPGFFSFLHPILPLGNAADALRSVGYFGNSQLLRPTAVLCAWTAAGATLILLGYLRQQRRLAQETADQTMTEDAPGPPAEDPTVMLPEPVALAPHQHHFATKSRC